MTDPNPSDIAAVSAATGHAVTPGVLADAYGLSIDAALYADPAALARELAVHARVAGLPDDEARWRLSDLCVALHAIHGEKWRGYMPRTANEDGDEPSPGTLGNLLTAGRAWPDKNTRAHWKRRGLTRSHLIAANKVNVNDPAAAAEWLEKAAIHGWTANELRRAMRGDDVDADAEDTPLLDRLVRRMRRDMAAAGLDLLSDTQLAVIASGQLDEIDAHERINGRAA